MTRRIRTPRIPDIYALPVHAVPPAAAAPRLVPPGSPWPLLHHAWGAATGTESRCWLCHKSQRVRACRAPSADPPREGRLGAPTLGIHPAEEAGRGLLRRGVGRAVEELRAGGHQDHQRCVGERMSAVVYGVLVIDTTFTPLCFRAGK